MYQLCVVGGKKYSYLCYGMSKGTSSDKGHRNDLRQLRQTFVTSRFFAVRMLCTSMQSIDCHIAMAGCHITIVYCHLTIGAYQCLHNMTSRATVRPWQIMLKNQAFMLCSYTGNYAPIMTGIQLVIHLQYILLTDFKLPCNTRVHVLSL